MRYQVPQFIEVEDKIFGPLTIKQFVYLAGGGGVSLAAFSTLPLFLAVFIAIPVGGLALALAFYKVNGRPFVIAMEHAFRYFVSHKLYLWHATQKETERLEAAVTPTLEAAPRMTAGKLRDLAWQLNIKEQGKGSPK